MKARRSLLALVALALPAFACQLLVGIDDHDFKTPEVEAAASEAGDAAPPVPSVCGHGVVPPPPPEGGTAPDQPDIVFAMRHASLRGRDKSGAAVGFDIDGVCSCDPTDDSLGAGRTSCTPPPAALRPDGCDDDGGVDDAIAYLFDIFAGVPGFGDATQGIELEVACGRQTLLYTLKNYNGQANDREVVIYAAQSVGIHEPHDGGVEADGGGCNLYEGAFEAGAAYPAKFDGTDVWSAAAGTTPALLTGWVRDFKLVLDGRRTTGSSVLPLLFGTRIVTIGTPILVAKLVPLDAKGEPLAIDGAGKILSPDGRASAFRIDDAVVSGRTSAADVLSAAGTIRVSGALPGQSELCAQPGPYCLLKSVVCSAVDTMKLPGLDFQGEPCDALSMVLQFDAVPAQVAAIDRAPEPPADGGCAPTWKDTCDGGNAICQ